ncbi:MAG: hypothetical protein QXW72_07580, partial [Conexivisphaerales archaeon]
EVLGILHEPEGKAVGESDELIRNPRRDLRMISTLRDICSTEQILVLCCTFDYQTVLTQRAGSPVDLARGTSCSVKYKNLGEV